MTPTHDILNVAHGLLGVHEIPDGSNYGPAVRRIQASTGAFHTPWCVSTIQYIVKQAVGHTIAADTANAYALAAFGAKNGWVRPQPVLAGPVVYHIGHGHAGTVVAVHSDGTFDAIEGNEGNAVRLVHRDPAAIRCTFLQPPYLNPPPHPGGGPERTV
jgi:hypothetical protein